MTQFRPTGYSSLPTIIKNLLIINGLVFFAQKTFGGQYGSFNFEDVFALHAFQSDLFRPWQLITHMFLHGDLGHIFGNMLALWMIGSILENIWGPKQFLLFYFLCGVGAAMIHLAAISYELMDPFKIAMADVPTMGASGAVFGILIAFVYLFPNTYIYIYFFIPMKAKWLGILYFSYELFYALRNSAGDNVARWAHVGGAIVGFVLVYIWKRNNKRF